VGSSAGEDSRGNDRGWSAVGSCCTYRCSTQDHGVRRTTRQRGFVPNEPKATGSLRSGYPDAKPWPMACGSSRGRCSGERLPIPRRDCTPPVPIPGSSKSASSASLKRPPEGMTGSAPPCPAAAGWIDGLTPPAFGPVDPGWGAALLSAVRDLIVRRVGGAGADRWPSCRPIVARPGLPCPARRSPALRRRHGAGLAHRVQ
jgi:hypothetical protein